MNILAFLLCGGMAYFLYNLTKEFTNLVMEGSVFLLKSMAGPCFSWRTGAEFNTAVRQYGGQIAPLVLLTCVGWGELQKGGHLLVLLHREGGQVQT